MSMRAPASTSVAPGSLGDALVYSEMRSGHSVIRGRMRFGFRQFGHVIDRMVSIAAQHSEVARDGPDLLPEFADGLHLPPPVIL